MPILRDEAIGKKEQKMELSPLSYLETMQLIQEVNSLADEQDGMILRTQQRYLSTKQQLLTSNAQALSKFQSDCEAAVIAVKGKSQTLISDARQIQEEIRRIDERISSLDKYYVKTKVKKQQELQGRLNDSYSSNADYFDTLNRIKSEYQALCSKYTENILPGLINGLNYLFSSQRKKDYEALIILMNTVDAFVNEITTEIPNLTADTVSDMRSRHEEQRRGLEVSHKNALESLERQYMQALNRIADTIDSNLNAILPDELVNYMSYLTNAYLSANGKVNTSCLVANNILQLGLIDYPIADFVQSPVLASYIQDRCKPILIENGIKFPFICATQSPFTMYVVKDGSSNERILSLMHSVMFSFLSSVGASHLTLSVIDCCNHGNSANTFFDAKKKMPELFDKKFYTSSDEAIEKISRLNDKVEDILQNTLGTQFHSIFDLNKLNPESDCAIELLTLFDFPKGLDEPSLSALSNIIEEGPRCGVFVLLSESDDISPDSFSREFISLFNKIKKQCVVLQQSEKSFTVMGLRYCNIPMPSKNDFNAFFSKYLLICEGIRNKGIAFPPYIKNLIDSKTEEELSLSVQFIKNLITYSDHSYGLVPSSESKYPSEIMIGMTKYPQDVFEDCFGVSKIKSEFSTGGTSISLPLVMDLKQSSNIVVSYTENKEGNPALFTRHIMWSFLSSVPINKVSFAVIDPEKKGGSVVQFLDFRKRCPDIFVDNIATSSDDIFSQLEKLNRRIDDTIQEKLGTRFNNILDYNISAPTRAEALTVLTIYDFPSGFDSRNLEMLENILKNGGKCGIYSVICNNQDIPFSSYDRFEERLENIKKYAAQIELRDNGYYLLPFNLPIRTREPLTYNKVDAFIDSYSELSKAAKNKGLSFSDILDKTLFSRDLSEGLKIPVGVGDGETIVPITFGVGSSHHALIAGATGSGKSTLLHTLIMSAMLHYSPDYLNLYLMDFKSGTEFKVYDGRHLPHIKLIALDAMQEFGESILEDLVAEMGRRSDAFKSVGASKLGEYVKLSGKPMPKILVIMDEFQVLFNDATNRKVAYNCAELTKRIVTEGRSFGIHLLMATQSTKIITDLTISTGTIEQMRIRIGLKCGEWDAHYLFTERNDTQALEMMKGPIGTAVMNPEYTEGSNVGFRAAYCDDDTQEKYLKLIEDTYSSVPCDMQSFEGGKTTALLSSGKLFGLNKNNPLQATIGTLIKVAPPLCVSFDKRRKHNTLICGNSDRMAENLANIYTLSILEDELAKLYCFDGERLLGPSAVDAYYEEFRRFGSRFILPDSRGGIIRAIDDVYEQYVERRKNNSNEPVFIMIKNLQFLDIIKSMMKGDQVDESDYLDVTPEQSNDGDEFDFGIDDSDTMGITEKLLKLIDDGTAYGIHFIVTCLEFQSVKECMYYGENILAKFPERFVFSLNDNDSDSLIENVSVASLRDNTVYYSDSVKQTFQMKPYVFPKTDELAAYIDRLSLGGEL